MNQVSIGHGFLRALQSSSVRIIPPALHFHILDCFLCDGAICAIFT